MPLEGYDVRTRITRHIQRDPEKQASIRKILWRAAVIIPLVTAIILVPLKTDLFKSRVEATTMNPLVSAEFEQNKIAIDERAKDDRAKDDRAKDDSAKTEEIVSKEAVEEPKIEPVPKVEVPQPVVTRSNVYYLITGSFKSQENALAQLNKLKAEGFTPELVVAPNGFFRVCAISCSDMNTAVTKKDSIAAQFPGAWISKKE
jgi:cell division protein FtsN